MKTKLNLIVFRISLALILAIGNVNVFAQSQSTNPTVGDPDLKIISDNTFTVNGMTFPKRAQVMGKTSGGICDVGQTRTMAKVIDVSVEAQPAWPKGKVTYEGTTPYSPPLTTWVISSYSVTDGSESGSSRVLTAIPGGYSFLTSSQYEKTYESLREGVLKMNILDKYKADIDSRLKSFTKNFSSYSQSMSASNGTVSLYVQLQAKGATKGRSWYKGTVDTVETCIPPEISDVAALKQSLQEWIAATIAALPNKGKPVIIYKRGDTGTAPVLNRTQIEMVTNPQPTPSPTPR